MAQFKLNPAISLERQLPRVLGDHLRRARLVVARRREPRKERIHAARLCCKKARALLKLVRSQDPAWCRRENRSLSDAARGLAALRDVEAMRDSFDLLGQRIKGGLKPGHFYCGHQALQEIARSTVQSPATTDHALEEWGRAIRQSEERIRTWRPKGDFRTVAYGLGLAYRRVHRGWRWVRSRPAADKFHEWRKDLKTFSYQCAFLHRAWPRMMKALGKESAELAVLLGEEHDLSVLRERFRGVSRRKQPATNREALRTIKKAIHRRRAKLRAKALRLGRRLCAEKPRAFVKRVLCYLVPG